MSNSYNYWNCCFADEERIKKKEEIERCLQKTAFGDELIEKLREFAKSAGGLIDGRLHRLNSST